MDKILIISNNTVGLIKFRGMLIESLMKTNEVICATPYDEEIDELKLICTRTINTPIDRRGINPLKDIGLFKKYYEILKTETPNLVITYTIKPNVYGGIACRILKIPYVVNITGLGSAFENGGIIKKLVTFLNRVACKDAKVVFFENEDNRQYFLKEKIVKDAQACKLNGAGVDIDKYNIIDYPMNERVCFLFIGRVMAEKGIDELLEATKKLIEDGIKCELDIVGEYEENYREKISKYQKQGWLHYYGYQKDVRPFIAKCHCFVLPSWHEGMANTNLESAACGRPIITSNIPGCKEAVKDGESGFLTTEKDSYKLYQIMKRFCALSYEERKSMGIAGRKHIQALFDKRKIVEDTIYCLGGNK